MPAPEINSPSQCGPYTIGVDVGGTKMLATAVELDRPGHPLAWEEVPTTSRTNAGLVDDLVGIVSRLAGDLGSDRLVGVGVGLPGLIERSGMFRMGPNLPGIIDLDLGRVAAERLGVPIAVDNDGNCAAWAEVCVGAAKGYDDVTFVGLGTGISCGIVMDGQLKRGGRGFAGEPGHATLVANGALCACGRRGCWEAYASGTALGRAGRAAVATGGGHALLELAGGDHGAIRGEHVTEAFVAGDAEAATIVRDFARAVGLGLSNLIAVLDPEVLVLGGSMIEVGAVLVDPIRASMVEFTMETGRRHGLDLKAAHLGRGAGAIGAALLPGATSGNDHRAAVRGQ